MALAIVKTKVNIKQAGGRRFVMGTFTFDATYAAGGYALTAADLGLTVIETLIIGGAAVTGTGDVGWLPIWDAAASKIKIYGAGTADAPLMEGDTNEASLTGSIAPFFAIGY